MTANGERKPWLPWLEGLLLFSAILAGAIHAWSSRNYMNPDGISYLDIGDAYFRGDWATAINAYWSPFYSWLLGAALFVARPSPYWEFTVVHAVNFVIYLFALGCFSFLLREVIRASQPPASAAHAPLPEWAMLTVGYAVFVWSVVKLVSVELVTPDLCVAAWVYLAAGLLLRMQRGAASAREFVGLGCVLGLAYMTKSAMFPLAFVFIAVAALTQRGWVAKTRCGVIVFGAFLLLIAPFIVAEILGVDAAKFWGGDPELQARILAAFERTEAVAVVGKKPRGFFPPSDWQRIDGTDYYVRILSREQ